VPQRPAHIAMIGSPLAGHVLPTVGILRELVRRGHRVTCANTPDMADMIRPTGAEFLPYELVLEPAAAVIADPIEAMSLLLEVNMQLHARLRPRYRADPPDLFLYDVGAFAARAFAESHGKPLVQLSPAHVGQQPEPELLEQVESQPSGGEYERRFAKWLAESGATTLDVEAFCGLPPRVLVLVPKVLQPRLDELDENIVTVVGPCLTSAADQDACQEWAPPPGAERVLLIAMGATYPLPLTFYRECLAAFGDLPGWHVVLQIGRNIDECALGDLPANVELHRWVPQSAMLRRADLFVTAAGSSSVAGALAGRVPMIAVPQGADHFSNADRLAEAGVARRIDTADVTAEALRTALRDLVTDPQVATRLEELGAEVAHEDATRHAADLIEDMLT
jgi:MGT family glycosyltransferase